MVACRLLIRILCAGLDMVFLLLSFQAATTATFPWSAPNPLSRAGQAENWRGRAAEEPIFCLAQRTSPGGGFSSPPAKDARGGRIEERRTWANSADGIGSLCRVS